MRLQRLRYLIWAGDGSVYRTDDGRWRSVVDLGFVDGKRKRKYVSRPTQAEALGKLRHAQREADAGVVSDDRMSVGHFLAPMVDGEPAGAGLRHHP